MIRTYKRKLLLTNQQKERITNWIGVCRLVYNMGLEISKKTYEATGHGIHKFELMYQITDIRDITWIKDVPSQCLQNSIERLNKSYNSFFKTHKKGGGFPKFASKRKFRSIDFKYLKLEGGSPVLAKLGKLKIVADSPIIGIPKTAQIIIEPTGFFITIQCTEVPARFESENQAVGLDMGLSHFCIDSNGNFISNPKHFKKYERQLRIVNRSISRKRKGSNRLRKQFKKLALLYHKIANTRKDFLHKESTIIARANRFVFIENLNIAGMVKNRRLSKHILDCGWGMFRTMLEYKTNVVRVHPKHTSQECSACGVIDSNSRISQSEFVCTNCGHISNADVNAAKNILSRGTAFIRQREAIACA